MLKYGSKYITSWEEGKYIDLWSLNHIVFGIIIGALFSLKYFSFEKGLIISVVIFLTWEFLEYLFNIREHLSNKTWDVITGLIGFCGGYYLVYVNPKNNIISLIITSFIFTVLEILGFLTFLKKKSDKK